ncbi:MAG TPA: hypothetical protein ENG35_01975 [Desulfobacteraceae bacterium]|nr:hypothetical protein [Desulfobacteraceae bacterium]
MTRAKALFALSEAFKGMITFGDMKKLANILGVAHITVRIWRSDQQVKERTKDFISEFVEDYLGELITISRPLYDDKASDAEKLSAIRRGVRLSEEVAVFHGRVLHAFLERAKAMILGGGPNSAVLVNLFARDFPRWIEHYPANDWREFFEFVNEEYKKTVTNVYRRVVDSIKAGDIETALFWLEAVQKDAIANIDMIGFLEKRWIEKDARS